MPPQFHGRFQTEDLKVILCFDFRNLVVFWRVFYGPESAMESADLTPFDHRENTPDDQHQQNKIQEHAEEH